MTGVQTCALPISAEVGELVLDAVRNERFWILTHPNEFIPLVERRLQSIKADHAHRMP